MLLSVVDAEAATPCCQRERRAYLVSRGSSDDGHWACNGFTIHRPGATSEHWRVDRVPCARDDTISATAGHAARSADLGAGAIGFALAFIGPIRRDKQPLIGASSKWYHCQQQCNCQFNHGSFISVMSISLGAPHRSEP